MAAKDTNTRTAEVANAIPPFKFSGRIARTLLATKTDRLGFVSADVGELRAELDGIPGSRHHGHTRAADARVPYLPRGTTIRNQRHLSIVSVEDLAEIARRLSIPSIDPATIGANVLMTGIPALSRLPRGTKLFCEGGAILIVEDPNAPCTLAGEAVQRANADTEAPLGLKQAFPKHAAGLRGVVASVEHPGVIRAETTVIIRVPEQWTYQLP